MAKAKSKTGIPSTEQLVSETIDRVKKDRPGFFDTANVEKKVLVFCDGDFWHGYRYGRKKKLPKKFWRDKIERNMERDRKVTRKLRADGWSVVRLWEHDIEKSPEKCVGKIRGFL